MTHPGRMLTAALVLFPWALACAPRSDGRNVAVRDSSGVTIVDNAAVDVSLTWRFATDFVLGGTDDGPQAWSYLGREVLGTDSAGDIYVLAVSVEGEVWVLDYGKGGYVRRAADGTPLEEVRPFVFPPANRQHYFEVAGGGLTVDVASLDAAEPREVRMLECGGMMRLPPLFDPELVWAAQGGRLAVSTSSAYVVDLYEDLGLRRSIRRALPVRAATADDAMKEVGEGMRVRFGNAQPCVFPADRLVEQRGFAPSIPWVGEVGIDGETRLWVERRALGRDAVGPVDVFGGDGAYAGTLPEGTPFPALFLPDGRIGVVERDELDVPTLRIERVVETAR